MLFYGKFCIKGLATLIIVNFREYLEYIRNMFVPENTSSIDAYVVDMRKSGQKQRETREKLKKEIAIITAKINFLREQLKAENNKQKISQQIKLLKTNKVELLKKLKQQSQVTRFAMLSDETKTVLCTLKVLRKYLTKELMENEFSGMKKDESGNLIFDSQVFENSFLYQDARHVFDYISAYIVQNPDKVVSESYFNKFFDKESGWRGIINHADRFFDAQSKRKKTRAEIIAESKSDLEVVKEYPQNGVILVRLKTPEALDYEGTAAHNCVGGGSYDKLLNKKQSGIYSLRRLTKDGELKPVVTIEYNDGVVKQIHGPCNGIVGFDYTMAARDAVLRLMNLDSIQDLVADKRFTDNILGCLGLYRDGKGSYFDIMNISEDVDFEIPTLIIEASSIKDYDFEKLKIKNVVIEGELTSADVKYISKFKHANKINIKALGGDCYIDLHVFNSLKKLEIDAKEYACTIANCGENIEALQYSGDAMPIIIDDKEISHFKLYVRKPQEISLGELPKAKEISLFGKSGTVINTNGCQSMVETLHMEEVSIDGLTTKELPNLQHLEITGSFDGDIHLPLLKTLKWNYFSNESHEFNLGLFPQIEELIFMGGKEWKDTTTRFICRGIYPNLKKMNVRNVIMENIDFECFPKLNDVDITANNDYEINLSVQRYIEKLRIFGAVYEHTCTLKGKSGKIKRLDIEGNIRVKPDIDKSFEIEQVAFSNAEIKEDFFHGLQVKQGIFYDCLMSAEIAKKYITGNILRYVGNYGNRIIGEIADFSDSRVINMSGMLKMDVKKIILPEKLDYFDCDTLRPETEVVGRCSPKTLVINSVNRILNYVDLENVEELSCYLEEIKDYLPLMPNLKHLQSYPIPAEMVPDSVETWHIHDSHMKFAFSDNELAELQKTPGKEQRLSLWNAKNVKNFSIHSFVARNTDIEFPQNIEECEIDGPSGVEEIDFSKYKRLKKLTISILDENLKKIKLPESIAELKADKALGGVGIISDASFKPMSIEWEIPETANPQVIKYLQNQYGNDNVKILKEQKPQAMLPMVIWQHKGLGGGVKG